MKKIQKVVGMLVMVASMLCSNASAVKLQDLHLPMTRDEADNTLTKDYNYTILSDSTIRRTWKLKGRKVHMDFKLNREGRALCIAIEYDEPTARKKVDKDIKAITGGKSGYKKLGKPKKNTNTYGMEHALGAKVKDAAGKGDGWIFVEHSTASRKKCTRLVYYASKPTRDRLSLGEAREDGGYTAMGSSGSSKVDISALKEDEEDRRSAKPAGKRVALADTPEEPVASSADDDFNSPDKDITLDDDEPVAQNKSKSAQGAASAAQDAESAAANDGKGFLPPSISEPVQKMLGLNALVSDILIVGLPLLLLIICCMMVSKRRANARRKEAERIMSKKPGSSQDTAE